MKKISKATIICLFLTSCSNSDGKVAKSKLTGYDYRLFQDTPAWPLAKAVRDKDTSEVKTLVIENKIDPDYQESRCGNTLLMMSIFNNNYASAKILLDVGADPNLRDRCSGATAVINAAENKDSKYLKLLLAYKGNPKVGENKSVKDNDSPMQTALTSAISYYYANSLEKVTLLIEAGADVNYPNNNSNTDLPLGIAIKRDKIDVALYFLENGADYKKVIYKLIDGHDVYILEALRKNLLDLQSPEYNKKLAVIAFLKGKGLDYYKEHIPDYVLKAIKMKYPKTWEEYAQKY
ncbi:ankyrin repeat domain-containing protein [Pedobacter sp. G11]|uniref:ankyrin repeat domain-containing protein n=1 Tax=Pedobacter sp. G11 TaxID=2482728 RepID=UPI000F5F1012|nr:ankyrin repeat domain-containing protein [Pedobacter sp. G11]AZI24035.1 ankyrin repeat domain-containing protein [Pedobacter sp. G11]